MGLSPSIADLKSFTTSVKLGPILFKEGIAMPLELALVNAIPTPSNTSKNNFKRRTNWSPNTALSPAFLSTKYISPEDKTILLLLSKCIESPALKCIIFGALTNTPSV